MGEGQIPVFQLLYDEDFRRRFALGSAAILDEGFLTNHTQTRAFERNFAAWNESKHALAASSGTAALEMIFRALDVRGREVILPSNTFIATATAVIAAGGIPVLADIESDFLALDPIRAKEQINSKTKVIVVVHIGGVISPRIKELIALCRDHNLSLVEDCAHAHGATLDRQRAGTFGIAGAFSFHQTKVMSTGEGGMVVTADDRLAESLVSVRQFGKSPENSLVHNRDGGNFKMTEMQALLGNLELERVDKRIAKRASLAQIYQRRLEGSSWLTYAAPRGGFSPHYKQVVLSPLPRSQVESHLLARGIALTGGVYYHPLHRQPMMRNFVGESRFPVSDQIADQHICPPCYPELHEDQVHRVCDQLLELKR